MPLQPGARLGPYEVLAPLGAGGMGEVYRARDTRLQREVAVKVLPELFAADPERLARFQREAQLLASLNHPNIGSIYGFEEAQGVGALVLELVDGPTLADRLLQGPIPVEDALPLARQVVDALEAAHERGIIHRDLKPANIKLRPDRTVKVLDFGLAKALEGNARTDLSASPTITSPTVTRAGVVLGTAAYMAPEQAKGREVDRTADVWAFGCVLYEMLGGRRPFDGESVTEVLAGVLKTEPDWRHLPADTPEAIRRLLRRCLQKEPRQRLQHIGDARLEIDEAQAAPQSDSRGTPIPTRNRDRLTVMVAGLVALVTGVMLSPLIFKPAPPGAEARLEISTPPTTDPLSLAISPDGQKVVFAATSDGRPQLWLRRLDSSAARPLTGTDFGTLPFWSPDSRSIGFFADGKLKRTAIDSGSVHEIAGAPSPMGGTWNRDDTILFAPGITGPVFQVSLKGGEPSALTPADGQFGHRHPQFLPDGRHFLYYLAGAPKINGVYVGALDKSVHTRLLEADTPAVYAASGHLLFVAQATLMAQRFDPTKLAVTGDPIRVADQVSGDAFGVPVSASAAGPIVYRTGSLLGQRQFVWVDRAGKELEKVGDLENAIAQSPAMSADGRRVALQRLVNGNVDIWWSETDRWGFKRATTDAVNDIHARWSPDGGRIVYASRKKGVYNLYERSLTQSDSERLVFESPLSKRPMDWSRDGRFLLFRHTDPKTGTDILALPMDGSARPFPVVTTDAEDTYAQFSPDGKWIVFETNKTGRPEVFVRAFPGPGPEAQVSVRGGAQARWAPDGREIFYIALDGRLMSVQFRATSSGEAIDAAAAVPLFATHVGGAIQPGSGPQYMVAPDGKRLLMNHLAGEYTSPITVILNWKANSR